MRPERTTPFSFRQQIASLPHGSVRPRGKRRLGAAVSGGVILALALTACAGSAGTGGGGGGGSAAAGFDYGAPQDEVDELLADLDPVTITFQPAAASPDSVLAPIATSFIDHIEERSGGKIEVDVVWGQAIAGFDEVNDALTDGRLDIAYTAPTYDPGAFPAVNDLGSVMASVSSSPLVGVLVANAVADEIAWGNESVIAAYEDQGLVPLSPFLGMAGYYSVCGSSVATAEDWEGTQVRVGARPQAGQVEALGGTPVSMEMGEMFEALQRGTVDCTLSELPPATESGLFEVAAEVGYATTGSFSRAPGANMAGSSFSQLALPYQQIIFDANALAYEGLAHSMVNGNADGVAAAKEAGGEVAPFDDDVQAAIVSYSEELAAEAVDNGLVAEDIIDVIGEAEERWTTTFEELGYADGGSVEEIDEWFDRDTEFAEYARVQYENGAAMEHRPR